MSDVEHVMRAPAQASHEAKPIETFGGGFNEASPPSNSDPEDDEEEMPCATVTAFVPKTAPSACRRPLFRR